MGTAKRLHASGIQDACMVEKSALVKSLAKLWDSQELCDCTLVTADQQQFQCHRLVLAAVSDYFNAVLVGTGQLMLNSVSKHEDGKWTIQLSEISGHSLQLLLQAVYQQDFQVFAIQQQLCIPKNATHSCLTDAEYLLCCFSSFSPVAISKTLLLLVCYDSPTPLCCSSQRKQLSTCCLQQHIFKLRW